MRKVRCILIFANSRGWGSFSCRLWWDLFANSFVLIRHSVYIKFLSRVHNACTSALINKSVIKIWLRFVKIFSRWISFSILWFWSWSKELILPSIAKFYISGVDFCFYICSSLQVICEKSLRLFRRHFFNRLFVSQAISIWSLRTYKLKT